MKTISLRKKVSAIAVASLGFGLLSVVPASAANAPGNVVNSINLTTVTASPKVGTVVHVNVGASVPTQTIVATDSFDLTGAITSYPAGGQVGVVASITTGAGATATKLAAPYNGTYVASGGTLLVQAAATTAVTANAVTSSATVGMGSYSFTPTKAGTYVLTVFKDSNQDGIIGANDVSQTVSITVADVAGYSAALSTALLKEDLDDAEDAAVGYSAATDAAGAFAIRTLGQKAATILVQTRDTANALYLGQTVTATMSGSGFVTAGNADSNNDGTVAVAEMNTGDGSASQTRTASVSGSTSGSVIIGIWADGTAGTGTVTISVTDKVSGATTTLATKTVTFYSGTAATIEAVVLQGRATAGAANGCVSATACDQASLANTPAVVIVAKDSGGRVIPGLTITGESADTAIIAATTVAIVTGGTDKNGRGYYNASVTGGAAANVGKSTTIVYSHVVSATLTIKTAPITITNAGTPATVTWSTDKTTYTPGAPVVITVTAKDAGGNAAADGTYATLFAGASTLGGSITGSTPAASVEIKGGVATYTAFAPGTAGTYVVSNKFGASMPAALQGAAISTSIVVSDPNAAIATSIASLNAKIVALNALIAKIMKRLNIR